MTDEDKLNGIATALFPGEFIIKELQGNFLMLREGKEPKHMGSNYLEARNTLYLFFEINIGVEQIPGGNT